jgi:single-strand DNA-binding protein
MGNLGKDVEIRHLPSGEAVAVLALATTEIWKDKQGQKQEKTDWHRVEFIGRIAEVCGEYLKKGSPVYIEGSIRYDKWTNKEGVEQYTTKIRGQTMQMIGGKGAGNSAEERQVKPRPEEKPKSDDFDDDIPF